MFGSLSPGFTDFPLAFSKYKPLKTRYSKGKIENYLARKYNLTAEDRPVYRLYLRLVKEIYSIPRTKNNFGLTHFDLHTSNYHVYKNQITFFDFADIQCTYYTWDVAKVFFSNIPFSLNNQKDVYLFRAKVSNFLEGFSAHKRVSKIDIERIKFFARIIEIRMYLALKENAEKLNDGKNWWVKNFMQNRREYILDNEVVKKLMNGI